MTSSSIPAPRLTIIVSTCDLFFDIWPVFFSLFWKRWPDCPYPIVLITNHAGIDPGPVRALRLGDDRGWSDNLIATLEALDTEFVMYMQEDHFLLEAISTDGFAAALDLAETEQLDFVAFRARNPRGEARFHASLPVFYPADDSTEAVFCDPTIWRRTSLRGLLEPGETAWDFLKTGRARASEKRYRRAQYHLKRLRENPIRYMKRSGVREFLWHATALALLRRERVPIGRPHRGLLLQSMHVKRALKKDPGNWALRAKYTGLGVGQALTRWQRNLSMRHVRKYLRDHPDLVVPIHSKAGAYLRKIGRPPRPLSDPT